MVSLMLESNYSCKQMSTFEFYFTDVPCNMTKSMKGNIYTVLINSTRNMLREKWEVSVWQYWWQINSPNISFQSLSLILWTGNYLSTSYCVHIWLGWLFFRKCMIKNLHPYPQTPELKMMRFHWCTSLCLWILLLHACFPLHFNSNFSVTDER